MLQKLIGTPAETPTDVTEEGMLIPLFQYVWVKPSYEFVTDYRILL
jgi:hypothetical protein